MSRTNHHKTRLAVEGLEGRNLTTGFSAQGALVNVGLTTVAQSPGLASVTPLSPAVHDIHCNELSESPGLASVTPLPNALFDAHRNALSESPGLASVTPLPNPDDPFEPHGPIGPVSRVNIIAI